MKKAATLKWPDSVDVGEPTAAEWLAAFGRPDPLWLVELQERIAIAELGRKRERAAVVPVAPEHPCGEPFAWKRPHSWQASSRGRPELSGLDYEELILRWFATHPDASMMEAELALPLGSEDGGLRRLIVPHVVFSLETEGRLVGTDFVTAGLWKGKPCAWRCHPDEAARLAEYTPDERLRPWSPALEK